MGRGNDHRSRQRRFGTEAADTWGQYAPQPSFERPPRPNPSWSSSAPTTEVRVKWFNPDKGFGFVELTDGSGEAFLHIRQVEAAGVATLEAGSTLVVQVGIGQKGPQVDRIVSIDSSTATPELASRKTSSRLAQFGGFARQEGSGMESLPPDMAGTVKWFDPAKGYGFVTVEGEIRDLFLHISVVQRSGLSTLEQGRAVRVAVVEGRKGREVGAISLA
jgi:CspA family cold shock protein